MADYPVYAVGQSVQLAQPHYHYDDPKTGRSLETPELVFPAGTPAKVLDRRGDEYIINIDNRYQLGWVHASFIKSV